MRVPLVCINLDVKEPKTIEKIFEVAIVLRKGHGLSYFLFKEGALCLKYKSGL
jgi:hypothetical protein